MAGVLTAPNSRADDEPSVEVAARALIGIRRALGRHAPGGSEMVRAAAALGGLCAGVTVALGLVRFAVPGRWVDLQATLALAWLIGWLIGPIAFRGGDGLRPEYFALVPIRRSRLAAGLLAASFSGIAPMLLLAASASLLVAAARLGPVALVVAVPAAILQTVVVVLVSKVCIATLTASLDSRRGQDLGALLMAVVIAVASGGWSLAVVMGHQIAHGPTPALATTLRILPTGWAAVAVNAADRADWFLAVVASFALVALAALLLGAWSLLLDRNMHHGGGSGSHARRHPFAGTDSTIRRRSGATGAVVRKELLSWCRDPGRWLGLLLAFLVSVLNIGVPALAFHDPGAHGAGALAALPWIGPSTALIAGMAAVNLYGNDGTAFWLTRMIPGSERADVRGRQLAWLAVVGSLTLILTVAATAASGQTWAWPWVMAALPALLGAAAGLTAVLSVVAAVREKDPQLRRGPFDIADDPDAQAAVTGQAWLTGIASLVVAAPGCAVVALGAIRHDALLQGAGVVVGVALGVAGVVAGGGIAARRLSADGAELMDVLRIGRDARRRAGRAPSRIAS